LEPGFLNGCGSLIVGGLPLATVIRASALQTARMAPFFHRRIGLCSRCPRRSSEYRRESRRILGLRYAPPWSWRVLWRSHLRPIASVPQSRLRAIREVPLHSLPLVKIGASDLLVLEPELVHLVFECSS